MERSIHILGICGTFMGSLAILARESGFSVSGSDENVYPPMSTLLSSSGIKLYRGYEVSNLASHNDKILVGNVMTRGQRIIEHILDEGYCYTSGPAWLAENVLAEKWVLAVSGTHGKTTTSSLLAWILEFANFNPGFLIGGIPLNFGVSARLGKSEFFVIEADEYDTAFFDKRSKFVHYRPKTLIINNIEYDHADIFPDIASIYRQFHHLVRCVPGTGSIIVPSEDVGIRTVLEKGCWTSVERFSLDQDYCGWNANSQKSDGSSFLLSDADGKTVEIEWDLKGKHNLRNAVAAAMAAHRVGISLEVIANAICKFKGVKRRLELIGNINGISIYDDFAHHPTAIASTLETLRLSYPESKIFALIELRSNTMKAGAHGNSLLASVKNADSVHWYEQNSKFSVFTDLDSSSRCYSNVEKLTLDLLKMVSEGDIIVLMSNGDFDQLGTHIIDALEQGVSR